MERLRLALSGKVSSRQLTENLDYYEDYINTEIRKGRSEEEVLAGLGDPRLIARTIVETGGGSGDSRQGRRERSQSGGSRASMEGGTFWEEDSSEEYSQGGSWYGPQEEGYHPQGPLGKGRLSLLAKVPLWAWLILALLVVVLVLSAIFSIIAALLPILLPILIVLFLVKVFRDWFN